jgi:hypothetical protein
LKSPGHRPLAHDIGAPATTGDDWRLDQLIERLPERIRSVVRFVRRPSARRLRIPLGILLTFGGFIGFLPILGFWMLPIGLALLADDVPPLRYVRTRILDWIERRHPHWLIAGSGRQ